MHDQKGYDDPPVNIPVDVPPEKIPSKPLIIEHNNGPKMGMTFNKGIGHVSELPMSPSSPDDEKIPEESDDDKVPEESDEELAAGTDGDELAAGTDGDELAAGTDGEPPLVSSLLIRFSESTDMAFTVTMIPITMMVARTIVIPLRDMVADVIFGVE